MKAKLTYKNGWLIALPNSFEALLLFVEWLSERDLQPKFQVTPAEVLYIRMKADEATYQEAVDFINSRL